MVGLYRVVRGETKGWVLSPGAELGKLLLGGESS